MARKVCHICRVSKDTSEFHGNPTTADLLDHRCKECKKEYQQRLKRVKDNAPPLPEDGRCELTGQIVETHKDWTPDHNHETDQFRGWIKKNVNKAMGTLGDSLRGMLRAAIYLSGGNFDVVRAELDTLERQNGTQDYFED